MGDYFDEAFTEEVVKSGMLTKEELRSRLTTLSTRQVRLGSERSCQFAALMLRGVYPEELSRPCQDAFVVSERLLMNGDKDAHWFQVFDGHGFHGHDVAEYCRDTMPQIASEIKACETALTTEELLVRVHETVNAKVHDNDDVPTNDSGTTAVSLMTVGDTLYCANVGDSRCILGVRNTGTQHCEHNHDDSDKDVIPKCLSKDHTFYRADERTRCRDAGGRVMTLTELHTGGAESEKNERDVRCCDLGAEIDTDGDPPRLFLPTAPDPGCAFSRSIGDDVATTIGCVATPEVVAHDLSDDDVLAVIATDGVWELMTNQDVLDVCTNADDPFQACYHTVAQSYAKWCKAEERVDDTCIIVLFFGTHKVPDNEKKQQENNNNQKDGGLALFSAKSMGKSINAALGSARAVFDKSTASSKYVSNPPPTTNDSTS